MHDEIQVNYICKCLRSHFVLPLAIALMDEGAWMILMVVVTTFNIDMFLGYVITQLEI